MFSGDCQCVYCGCKINFSGNVISYQNQRCANHNQEHQFPGMNIIVNEINNNNNSYFKNLPLTNQRKSSLNPFKHPKILKPRKLTPRTSTNLHNYSMKEFKRHDMKQEKIIQTTIPVIGNTSHGNIGKHELNIKINAFKLICCKLGFL